jgi:hypothetical protein
MMNKGRWLKRSLLFSALVVTVFLFGILAADKTLKRIRSAKKEAGRHSGPPTSLEKTVQRDLRAKSGVELNLSPRQTANAGKAARSSRPAFVTDVLHGGSGTLSRS